MLTWPPFFYLIPVFHILLVKKRNLVHMLIEMQSWGSHIRNIAGNVPYSVNRRGDKIKEGFVVLNLASLSSEHLYLFRVTEEPIFLSLQFSTRKNLSLKMAKLVIQRSVTLRFYALRSFFTWEVYEIACKLSYISLFSM